MSLVSFSNVIQIQFNSILCCMLRIAIKRFTLQFRTAGHCGLEEEQRWQQAASEVKKINHVVINHTQTHKHAGRGRMQTHSHTLMLPFHTASMSAGGKGDYSPQNAGWTAVKGGRLTGKLSSLLHRTRRGEKNTLMVHCRS